MKYKIFEKKFGDNSKNFYLNILISIFGKFYFKARDLKKYPE